ncbi:hypothetical protein H180DRAFT_03927 [Streptomyces sp. WMMB 322]|nr:hypothetical protein H180DRAFT_03927 [Streptomyces sp. WMMB 322]
MTADEAGRVDRVMRSLGIPGVVAPIDPEAPSGEWRVYDHADPETRSDTTADVLAAIAEHVPAKGPGGDGPTRGFIGLPPYN